MIFKTLSVMLQGHFGILKANEYIKEQRQGSGAKRDKAYLT